MRIRITFAKQGALRYTGHLDLHKLWERAARRAELPLAYSHGFHPQPKMNIAAALPLGFSSRCEVIDMRLEREISLEGLREKLQGTLPTGIQVSSIETVDDKLPALQTLVTSAEYEVTLTDSSTSLTVRPQDRFADAASGGTPVRDGRVDRSELELRIDSVMAAESILRERRGKTYDLRPLIEELSLIPSPLLEESIENKGHGIMIFMRLAAREGATGRPEEVLDMLGIAFEETRIERTQLHFNLVNV